jgi:hypothetical protein
MESYFLYDAGGNDMKRNQIALVCGLALIGALAGCSKNETPKVTPTPTTAPTATVAPEPTHAPTTELRMLPPVPGGQPGALPPAVDVDASAALPSAEEGQEDSSQTTVDVGSEKK